MTNEELERLLKIEAAARKVVNHEANHRWNGLGEHIDALRAALGPPKQRVKMDPGKRLKQLREMLRLSPHQLGERAGLSPALIIAIELGERQMTTEQAWKFAEAMRCTASDITDYP